MNISVAAGGRDWRSSAPRPAGAFQASHSRFFAPFLIHCPELDTDLSCTKRTADPISNRRFFALLKLPDTLPPASLHDVHRPARKALHTVGNRVLNRKSRAKSRKRNYFKMFHFHFLERK